MDGQLLARLCQTPGVPGREDQVRELMRELLQPLAGTTQTDAMGNLIAVIPGNGGPKVLLAAHMDEIGFIVKHIDDKGFIRLQNVGGFDPRTLYGQRVQVHARQGDPLTGAMMYASKPPHLLTSEEKNKPLELENFFVDLGLDADAVKQQVRVGDMVTMQRDTVRCGPSVVSKALDDRLGLFVIVEALKQLDEHEADIHVAATAQEEVGLRGASTVSFDIEPDVAVAVDVTLSGDHPGPADHESATSLGAGAAIKIMDGSVICHPKLVDHFRDIAERDGIQHQMEVLPRGGNDAGALQRTRTGAASITLSLPIRYCHSVNEMARVSDIEASIQLLATYLKEAHTRDYAW